MIQRSLRTDTTQTRPSFRPLLLACIAAVVGTLASAAPLYAQNLRNDYFVHEFWAELEPMADPLTTNAPSSSAGSPAASTASSPPSSGKALSPPPVTKPLTEILKEAQYVYSGMIYGFSFTYVPGDTTRGIAESFELKPIAQIKWGDPHLKVLDSRVDSSRVVARVMYSLAPFQETWTHGWDSNVYPTATGRGTSRYFLSYDEKIASYRDAMKEAIRDYLRQRIYNKPRKVTGQLVLRGSPYTIIDSGQYVTTLTVKLRIDKVQPYSVY